MMIGIPIYSDVSTIHDYVVQSDGAFDETIRGILNLKRHGQKLKFALWFTDKLMLGCRSLPNFSHGI
jgi:hypothetical protein